MTAPALSISRRTRSTPLTSRVEEAGVQGYTVYNHMLLPTYSRVVARSGCPNLIERIEAGLTSYGNDVTRADTALEAGMARYCSLDAPVDAIGIEARRSSRTIGSEPCR
jgi:hypothetical protein